MSRDLKRATNKNELLETVEWIQENDYPIRGTYE